MAEQVQGPILSVGASFDDLRQKRNEFRDALGQFRVDVVEISNSIKDAQRAARLADSDDEKASYQKSIEALQKSLGDKRLLIVKAQKDISEISRQVPSLPLKVEVAGGKEAIEILSLIRDQFGEVLGPLNGITGRISSLISTFKILANIASESTKETATGLALAANATLGEAIAASEAAAGVTKHAEAKTADVVATAQAATQTELFTVSLEQLAVAEKAGVSGTFRIAEAIGAEGLAAKDAAAQTELFTVTLADLAIAEQAGTAGTLTMGAAEAATAVKTAEATLTYQGKTAAALEMAAANEAAAASETGFGVATAATEISLVALLATAAGAAVAILATGLAAFESGKQTAELAHQYDLLAQRVGVTAQEIQGMTLVAASSGISIDEFATSLQRLSFSLAGGGGRGASGGSAGDLDSGMSRVQRSLETLIGSVKNSNGTFLSPIEIFKKLADQFKAMPDGIQKTGLAMEYFGRSGAQLIPALNKGSAGIQEFIDQANRLGVDLDGQPQKMTAWEDATAKLGLAWQDLKSNLADTGVFAVVTSAIDFASEALSRFAGNAGKKIGTSIKKQVLDAFKEDDQQTLSEFGQKQVEAITQLAGKLTTNKPLGTQGIKDTVGQYLSTNEAKANLADVFPKREDLLAALNGIDEIEKHSKNVADEAGRENFIRIETVALIAKLSAEGKIQLQTQEEINTAIEKGKNSKSAAELSSGPAQQGINKFISEVQVLDKEIDKAQAKYNILGTFSDKAAQDKQKDLAALRAQIAAVGPTPQSGTLKENEDYKQRLQDAQPLIQKAKTDVEALTKARETETTQVREETREIERQTLAAKKAIAGIQQQAAAEVTLASAQTDSVAQERLAVAAKEAQVEIDKLLTNAVNKRGVQIQSVVDIINQESDAIRANIAIKLVAADIAKNKDDIQKQIDKYNEEAAALDGLAAAFASNDEAAIGSAALDQKLSGQIKKVQDLTDEYALLAQTVKNLNIDASFKPQGPTQAGGHLLSVQETLAQLGKDIDAAKSKLGELRIAAGNEAFAKFNETLKADNQDFAAQAPLVEALQNAFLQTAADVRQAEIELKLYQIRRDAVFNHVPEDKLGAFLDGQRAKLQASSDQTERDQVFKEAAQFSLNRIYDETIGKLEKVRTALISQRDTTLLVDAAIYDAQNNLIHQWDDAAAKVGTLRQRMQAFFNEMILAGKDFGSKVFASFATALDDLSTQLASFLVTGTANFKQMIQSLAQSIVKSGIQSLFGDLAKSISGGLKIDLPGSTGKADGSSQSSALWVKMAGIAGGVAAITPTGEAGGTSLLGALKSILSPHAPTTVPFTTPSLGKLGGTGPDNLPIPGTNSSGQNPLQQIEGDSGLTSGGSSFGPIIGGAGVGGAIGAGVGGGAGAVGGTVAGAGLASVISGISGAGGAIGGATAGALGILGPIAAAAGIALLTYGIISNKIKSKTAELAKQLSASFQTIVDQYNAGNTSLVDAIQQTEQARQNAINQLSGKKGGQSQLASILPQFDQEIAQLKAAQKGIVDSFNKLALSLQFPNTLQGTIKSLQDLNDQVKKFIDAGGSAATAAQVFGQSLNQIKASTADNLLHSEQSIISAMLQENDLIKQRADLIKSTTDQINGVLNQGVLSRSQSVGQSEAQQIKAIQDNTNTQLKALDDQKTALEIQIEGQKQLFGLSDDVTTLKATQLAIEKQISAEQVVQIAAQQKLLLQLQALPPGATSVDLAKIASGQGAAPNAQLEHDNKIAGLEQEIKDMNDELHQETNANGYNSADRKDLRDEISLKEAELKAAKAAPVVQQPNTGVAAATDKTIADSILLALGGPGGLAASLAAAMEAVFKLGSAPSTDGGVPVGGFIPVTQHPNIPTPPLADPRAVLPPIQNITVTVNGTNLSQTQLTAAIKDGLNTAYKGVQIRLGQ